MANQLNTATMEDQLSDLMKVVIEKMILLNPDLSGEDDQINQLELIYARLCEAHSELLTYKRKY